MLNKELDSYSDAETMGKYASRVLSIDFSATTNLIDIADELIRKGIDVIQLSVGEPDFNTPAEIVEYAYQAMKEGKTHYTPSAGIAELRKGIAEKVNKKYSTNLNYRNVLVTPTKFGIFLVIASFVNEGESVLIPDPGWVSYAEMTKLNGARDLYYSVEDCGKIDEEEIKEKIDQKNVKAIIVNSPSNPLGTTISKDQLKFLKDLSEDKNIIIVSDEVYDEIYFEERPTSMLEVADSLENIVVVNGFSKSHAMTGWRVGYIISSESNIKNINKIQQHTLTCAPSISQYAALKALECDHFVEKMRETYRRRRDIGYNIIKEFMVISKPSGAFYFFPKYNNKLTSQEIAERLLREKGVAVVPGRSFGKNGEYHIRISFSVSEEKLIEGLSRIEEFFRAHL